MCVKYERFRRCKGGKKNRINAPSVANFARKLKNNAAEERESPTKNVRARWGGNIGTERGGWMKQGGTYLIHSRQLLR